MQERFVTFQVPFKPNQLKTFLAVLFSCCFLLNSAFAQTTNADSVKFPLQTFYAKVGLNLAGVADGQKSSEVFLGWHAGLGFNLQTSRHVGAGLEFNYSL